MINKVILVGRITKDPELKYTQSNVAVCTFTLAVSRQFQNQQGEREADFISCTVWRNQAENLAKFIRKGGLLGVEGRIQTRSYEAEDGNTRYVTEVATENIQFLEPKGNDENTQTQRRVEPVRQQQTTPTFQPKVAQQAPVKEEDPFFNESTTSLVLDDDLPF